MQGIDVEDSHRAIAGTAVTANRARTLADRPLGRRPFKPHVLSDAFTFVREWGKNPLSVAAVAPSGRQLANLITSEIDASAGDVLELGPGTGVFTRSLLERGIDERRITMIEQADTFADVLSRRFPKARLLRRDAATIAPLRLFDGGAAGAAVSGLGLRSMPDMTVERIVAATFAQLRRDASFYQFTYGPVCPVSDEILQRLDLTAECIGTAWRNLPPARVYRLKRRNPAIDNVSLFLHMASQGPVAMSTEESEPESANAPAWTRKGELQSQI